MKLARQTYRYETDAVAMTSDEQPISVFIWRDRRLDPSARVGDVVPAIVRTVDKGKAEAFVELSSGEMAFFNLSQNKTPPTEGARINVAVRAESQGDKLAVVRPTHADAELISCDTAMDLWRTELGIEGDWDISLDLDDRDYVSAAFDEAMASSVTLARGGELHIDKTRALTAVDVDSSGRAPRASNLELNADALSCLARHISLRRIAGLVVVDLCGSIRGKGADQLREPFIGELKSFGVPKSMVLKPSPLGLIEMSIERRGRPLSEYDLASCCEARRETETLADFLRSVENHAQADRTTRIKVALSADLSGLLSQVDFDWLADLGAIYGNRFQIAPDRLQTENFQIRSVT